MCPKRQVHAGYKCVYGNTNKQSYQNVGYVTHFCCTKKKSSIQVPTIEQLNYVKQITGGAEIGVALSNFQNSSDRTKNSMKSPLENAHSFSETKHTVSVYCSCQ